MRKTARLLAASRGEKKYEGKKCRRAHSGLRYVSSNACVECSQIAQANLQQKLRWLKAGLDENGEERLP